MSSKFSVLLPLDDKPYLGQPFSNNLSVTYSVLEDTDPALDQVL
jgi:hypothetical protein